MRFKKALALLTVFSAFALSACDLFVPNEDVPPEDNVPPVEIAKPGEDGSFLSAKGEDIVNADGDKIMLRGINAGGLFVTEHWMTGFPYGSTPSNDYRSLTQTLISRFGEEQTQALWSEYEKNWWSDEDFKNCADMGFTCIRLPFTYMNVDFAAVSSYDDAGKEYDFSALDAFVEKAADYGMYTVLDLHGAYGSQNGQDHSGEIIENASDVRFYSDLRMRALTADLWAALAEHYKDNSAVAGYDILNEPGEKAGLTTKAHWDCFDEIYDAIRAVDGKHIIIMESCWDAENLPHPSAYGWSNVMYSFHHYAGDKLSYDEYVKSWDDKLASVAAADFGVPLQMGEFTNYTSEAQWEYVLELMNRSGWHWSAWTYKVWGRMPWGVVNVIGSNSDKVNVSTDKYEAIIEKFGKLHSSAQQKYAFASGKTLQALFTEYAKMPIEYYKLPEGSYSVYNDEGWLALQSVDGVGRALCFTDNPNLATKLKITVRPFTDGSLYLLVRGYRLSVAESDGECYVVANDATGRNAAFYAEECEHGRKFYACGNGKYLRLAADGFVYADATQESATEFTLD